MSIKANRCPLYFAYLYYNYLLSFFNNKEKIEKNVVPLRILKMPTIKVKSFDRTINPGGGVPRTVTVKSHERHIKSPEKPGK